MKFEKGKQYECIKDVIGKVSNDWYYKKGNVYLCEKEGCLTDEDGMVSHSWDVPYANEHFKPHEQPKLGDKVLVWDDDESRAEELIFLAKVDGEYPYLVFGCGSQYEYFKKGDSFDCLPYKNMKPLPKVETVSLKEALSILEAHKGVKCRIEGCE